MGSSYKDEFIEKINWIAPKRGSYNSISDVSISRVKTRSGDDAGSRYGIVFRNSVSEMITDTGFYVLGAHKNRVLFQEATRNAGYKLTNRKDKENTGTTYSTVYADKNSLDEFIGDYDLLYDDFLELYYVERSN